LERVLGFVKRLLIYGCREEGIAKMKYRKLMIGPGKCHTLIEDLVDLVRKSGVKYELVYGVPRGGLIPAVYLSHMLEIPLATDLSHTSELQVLIVDDIMHTGRTMTAYNDYHFAAIFSHRAGVIPNYYASMIDDDKWIVFPWELDNEPFNR
jgi:hypothetical protein